MGDDNWDDDAPSSTPTNSFAKPQQPSQLGVGRGKVPPSSATSEPPSGASKWNGGGASSFGSNNANNNSNENGSGGTGTFGSFGSSSRGGFGGGSRGGFGGGSSGGFSSGAGGGERNNNCYNCQQPGHRSAECPEPKKERGGGGGGGTCYNCQGTGHMSRDCPEPKKERTGGGGGGGGTCYNCQGTGHMSRDCPEPKKERTGGGGGGGGSCYNCGQSGHMSRECTEPKKPREGGSSFGGGSSSFGSSARGGGASGGGSFSFGAMRSNQQNGNDDSSQQNGGSTSSTFSAWRPSGAANGTNGDEPKREFPSAASRGGFSNFGSRDAGGSSGGGFGSSSSGERNNNCYNCQQPGHRSAECPEPKKERGGGGGGGGGNCYNCGQSGHMSRECPEPKKPREGGGGAFGGFGGGGARKEVSDDIFDQEMPSDRPQVERFVPPPQPTSQDQLFGDVTTKGENFGKYLQAKVVVTPEGRVKPISIYDEANLGAQIMANIRLAQYDQPTPIQCYTLPAIRQGDDIMACAQTGSGKTAAFLLPIIANLLEHHSEALTQKYSPPAPFCLIISPTRELALQTERQALKFAFQTPVKACSAIGGHDMFTVSDRLKEGCHILSGTTGRLKDMVEKGRLSLKEVKYFVLDEADRMLDTGFEPDIRKLEELGLPHKDSRNTYMFSATLPPEVQQLAKAFLRPGYVHLLVGTPGGANEDITQSIEEVREADKKDRLIQLLDDNLKDEKALIFVETKRQADYIGALLSQKKLSSTTMHGDRTMRQRTEAVEQFSTGPCKILVATSVAARGLDFPLIGYVVNYHLPDSSDFYVHRIGRTGRAGHTGKSISFFDPDRDSDKRIAPELVTKLTEAGQPVPEFLKAYADGGFGGGFGRGGGYGNNDTRAGGQRNQSSAAAGGSTAAGTAGGEEEWD